MNKAKFRDLLAEYFNSSELHNLCFDLDIKHESIAGDTIEDKARELITYCFRHGMLDALVNRCRELRSHVDWTEFVTSEVSTASPNVSQTQKVRFNTANKIVQQTRPIKITGIIVEDVTLPRNDGTRGSALYQVPIQLSRKPSSGWADLFVETWNHPPRYTTMHRPGIAQIIDDRIILNGTTMEEIEDYHLDTLKLIIERVNKLHLEREKLEQKRLEEKKRQNQKHINEVKNISDRLKFD